MIRQHALLTAFEKQQGRQAPDYERNARIFEALYEEARALGVLPLSDPLEGIDVDVRRTRRLHVQTSARKDRPGA